jgi:hypothetical protein
MAKKKISKEALDKVKEQDGVVAAIVESRQEEPVPLCMTEIELLKLKLFESEIRRCSLEASLKFTAKQEYLRLIDPENKLGVYDRDMKEFMLAGSKAREDFNSVMKSIGDRLKIDMKAYNYDDTTGNLIPVPDES